LKTLLHLIKTSIHWIMSAKQEATQQKRLQINL
jgi:hypothetical protein